MGARAQSLAEGFEQANNEIIGLVEQLADDQWQARCSAEGWSVGVTVHHVADDHALLSAAIQSVAIGLPLPQVTAEMVNRMNAKHAQQHVDCTKERTLQLLRKNGTAAAAIIRQLTDDQLDKTVLHPFRGGESWKAEHLVDDILTGHIRRHLESVRTAAGL